MTEKPIRQGIANYVVNIFQTCAINQKKISSSWITSNDWLAI